MLVSQQWATRLEDLSACTRNFDRLLHRFLHCMLRALASWSSRPTRPRQTFMVRNVHPIRIFPIQLVDRVVVLPLTDSHIRLAREGCLEQRILHATTPEPNSGRYTFRTVFHLKKLTKTGFSLW